MPRHMRGVPGFRAAPRTALDAWLAAPRLMRLGVTEPDGTPLVHPVWYTWEHDHFLVHIGARSAKRRAIEMHPIVYCIIDAARSGTVCGVCGKAQGTLALEATRVREVVPAQCEHYAGAGDAATHRFLRGMVERGALILALLPPHALVTWGL
jgi:hypothetical protein